MIVLLAAAVALTGGAPPAPSGLAGQVLLINRGAEPGRLTLWRDGEVRFLAVGQTDADGWTLSAIDGLQAVLTRGAERAPVDLDPTHRAPIPLPDAARQAQLTAERSRLADQELTLDGRMMQSGLCSAWGLESLSELGANPAQIPLARRVLGQADADRLFKIGKDLKAIDDQLAGARALADGDLNAARYYSGQPVLGPDTVTTPIRDQARPAFSIGYGPAHAGAGLPSDKCSAAQAREVLHDCLPHRGDVARGCDPGPSATRKLMVDFRYFEALRDQGRLAETAGILKAQLPAGAPVQEAVAALVAAGSKCTGPRWTGDPIDCRAGNRVKLSKALLGAQSWEVFIYDDGQGRIAKVGLLGGGSPS